MLSNYFKEEQLEKIERTNVFIIGCGGLGSNVSKCLVRCGFKNIVLMDYDFVEFKNLNRQDFYVNQVGMKKVEALKENLININSDINVKTLDLAIDDKNLSLLDSADVVVEAVDDAYIKTNIFEYCLSNNIKVVSATGIAGYGDFEEIKVKRGRGYSIVGDFKKSIEDFKPLSPKVSIIASLQADEVLRMVIGCEK